MNIFIIFTKQQLEGLKIAGNEKIAATVTIELKNIYLEKNKNSLKVKITRTLYNRIIKAFFDNKTTIKIKFSKSQIGGFLPFLIPIITAILGGVTSTGISMGIDAIVNKPSESENEIFYNKLRKVGIPEKDLIYFGNELIKGRPFSDVFAEFK